MHATDIRLHFKHDEVYQGLAAMEGFMYLDEDEEHLVMEYQVKDSLFGVVKSDPKTLRIPLNKIRDIRYKRNMLVSRFRFSVNDFELLSKFPVSKNGRISVKIKRHNKELAAELAAYLNWRLSGKRLDSMAQNDPFLGG